MSDSYPQFISNSPIGEDLFEGKSQDRVATYICENLISNEQCKIIGIDGGWGTGKSNLIEITKRKLDQKHTGKYHFFVYDAWGHQEDLQRRSILEELTFFLTGKTNGKSIINDASKWEKKLKMLLAKSKETQKKTIPSLSIGVVFYGLLFILTPLFKALSDLVTCTWLKILIIAIPLILLLFLLTFYYCVKTDKSLGSTARLNLAIQKLFYIYQKSQQSDTTFETIAEDEPSVKKFRDWMRDIAEDLGENRLIIVFDNMDRLPDTKITELWSSIHTFFAEEKYEKIKVIIPFDRQNIKEAFKHNDDENHSYTDDFINKTFDVVYRVSPPILSDWKKFFKNKWLQAFNIIDSEFEKVTQIFDHSAVHKTPRDMVVFINECVAAQQINPTIPLRYIALFVLNKNTLINQSETEIIRPSYLKGLEFLYKIDGDLPKFMAAVIYQIDPDRALEVVFTDRLKTALNANDKTQIALISESPDFSMILDKAIMEVDNISNPTLALNDLGDKVSSKIWDDFYYKLGLQTERLAEAKISPYQLILLTKVTDKDKLIKNLVNLLIDATQFIGVDYYNSLLEIERTIQDIGLSLKLSDFLIDKKISASDFVSLLKTIKNNNTYKLYCDNAELNKHLEDIDSEEEWQNSEYLARIPDRYRMNKFIDMLTTKITDYSQDSESLPPYVIAYRNISKTVLKPILNDDAIHTQFTGVEEISDFYYDIICMRIARWDNYSSNYAEDFEEILADDSEDTVKGIAKLIQRYVTYGDLLLKVPFFDKPLVKAVILDILTKKSKNRQLAIVSVLSKVDNIIEALEIEPQILCKELENWSFNNINKENIASVLPNTKFFEFSNTYVSQLTAHLNKIATEYYQELPYDNWLVELEKQKSPIILTSLIVLKNQYPSNATSAIKAMLEGIAKGNNTLPEPTVWNKIIEKINKNTLRSTMKDVRDIYVSSKEIDAKAFLFFGDWLFEYGDLVANKGTLRRIFRKSILQESTVNLILRHSEEMKNIYDHSEDKEDFSNEIKVLLTDGGTHIMSFANILGIRAKTKKDKKEDQENNQ
jgi:hypothetical protein